MAAKFELTPPKRVDITTFEIESFESIALTTYQRLELK